MSLTPGSFYDFPPFRLDPVEGILLRDGKPVSLTPKALGVLLVLVEHHGHIVHKEDLLREVWPDTFVEEGNLVFNISVLRKILGQTPNCASYIETIPKRGYRFTAPVKVVEPESIPLLQARSVNLRKFTLHGYHKALAVTAMVLALALVATLYLARKPQRAQDTTSRAMLAVLPVENLTGDIGLDYVADGLTEEIISQVGTLNPARLGVIARTSSMTYKNKGKTVAQIGHELQIDYVLECSLRQWGDRVRISAQLIAVRDQAHIWAENYQNERGDILKMQSDVAKAIAGAVSFTLTPEQASLAASHPVDPQVHELCFLGRFEWNMRTDTGLNKAIDYFKQAIERDRNYAPAYAGLADAYAVLPYYSRSSPKDTFPEARAAAEKALQLDESLWQAHTVLGLIACTYYNFAAAEREYKRALQLNPNYATAHHWYAFCLWTQNRRPEALGEFERARQLDPRSLIIYTDEARALTADHQTDRAIDLLKKAIGIDSQFADAHRVLSVAYVQNRQMLQAIEEARRAVDLDANNSTQATLGYVYATAGRTSEARQILAELADPVRHPVVPPFYLSFIYMGLGEKNEALSSLERAYREDSLLNGLDSPEVIFDPLWSDQRFLDLLRRNALKARSHKL